MKTVDTRGTSCPQPVILTKKAVDAGEKSFEILIDNNTAKNNIERFLKNAKINFTIKEDKGEYIVKVGK